MSEATFEQANLQLSCTTAREPRLRDAREWLPTISIRNSGRREKSVRQQQENANMRQVLTYGDGRQHVQSRPRQRRPSFETAAKNGPRSSSKAGPCRLARNVASQKFLASRSSCKRLEAWREKNSPGSNAAIRKVIAQMREARQAGRRSRRNSSGYREALNRKEGSKSI